MTPTIRSILDVPAAITYNDFVGDKFYQRARRTMTGAKPEAVAGLTLCAAHVNAALKVFPTVLRPDSICS